MNVHEMSKLDLLEATINLYLSFFDGMSYLTYRASQIIGERCSIYVALPNASVKTAVVCLILSFNRVEAYKAVVNY